ncbi:MAG: hypothetical protein JSS86_12365 [Cyanobacteria bacterium SZAS LIN-2]|nr:hypothetical protein [Cyanobacteria bacterium SZAS LIN-2]
MSTGDNGSLLIGSILAALVGYGILTGQSTSRINISFGKDPLIWCIASGMQLFIAVVCLLHVHVFQQVAPSLCLPDLLNDFKSANKGELFVIFILGSTVAGGICYGLRRLVIAISPKDR